MLVIICSVKLLSVNNDMQFGHTCQHMIEVICQMFDNLIAC